MLTREQILSADDLKRQEVEVLEWGGSVYVRTFNGSELEALSKMTRLSGAAVVALAAVDATGARLFTEADVEALAEKNGKVLDRIGFAALRFNGMTEDGIADAGNV